MDGRERPYGKRGPSAFWPWAELDSRVRGNERRGALMDVLIQQFFNLDIMARALPLVLQGLRQTLLLCLIVIPLGLFGGLLFSLASLARFRTVRYGMILAIDF